MAQRSADVVTVAPAQRFRPAAREDADLEGSLVLALPPIIIRPARNQKKRSMKKVQSGAFFFSE